MYTRLSNICTVYTIYIVSCSYISNQNIIYYIIYFRWYYFYVLYLFTASFPPYSSIYSYIPISVLYRLYPAYFCHICSLFPREFVVGGGGGSVFVHDNTAAYLRLHFHGFDKTWLYIWSHFYKASRSHSHIGHLHTHTHTQWVTVIFTQAHTYTDTQTDTHTHTEGWLHKWRTNFTLTPP